MARLKLYYYELKSLFENKIERKSNIKGGIYAKTQLKQHLNNNQGRTKLTFPCHINMICCQNNDTNQEEPEPILDFWGALRKTGGLMKEWMNALSMFHSVLKRAHRKRSRNSISSAARHAFNSFFLFVSRKRLYNIHVTWFHWFYIERVTAPH